jgi:hypothetical protein
MGLAEPVGEQGRVVRRPAPPAIQPAEIANPAGRLTRISTAWSALGTGRGWPLALLIAVQAALTLRLIWTNTAFSDEALYLWAGRLELAHFLHGAPLPAFSTYFSCSPLIYPPLAAVAAAASGLAGARVLSMAMMLAATVMLHGITRRPFDRRSAFFAAGLFAGLAGAQFLGASRSGLISLAITSAAGPARAVVGLAGVRLGQADAELLGDNGEQFPGLVVVHGPDALEQFRPGAGLLTALAGQRLGCVRPAGRPQLRRRQAGHGRHPGHGTGRAVHLRIDAGTHHLVAAGDLAPAAFAQPGPARGLARRQSLPDESCHDKRPPRGRLRAFGHGCNLRMNFALCLAHH